MPTKSFTDLIVWQKSHQLVLKIYHFTKTFPSNESFGLTSQIRRAAVSITSNIAEGFPQRTVKEKHKYYYASLGSLTELQNQIIIAKDLGYLKQSQFTLLEQQSIEVQKLLYSFIKSATKLAYTRY